MIIGQRFFSLPLLPLLSTAMGLFPRPALGVFHDLEATPEKINFGNPCGDLAMNELTEWQMWRNLHIRQPHQDLDYNMTTEPWDHGTLCSQL